MNIVQSSKRFNFLKSKAMIGTGSAGLWVIFWNPTQRIWKAERQICLLSLPRETLQGELVSDTILRRSLIKQEPRVLYSCGASMQNHRHSWVKVLMNVECLQPAGPWLNFGRNWNTIFVSITSTDATKHQRGALQWSRIILYLGVKDPFCPKECSQEQRYLNAHLLSSGSMIVNKAWCVGKCPGA